MASGRSSTSVAFTLCLALAFDAAAIEIPEPDPNLQRAQELTALGHNQYAQQDFTAALESYSGAVALLEERFDPGAMALVEPLRGLAQALMATQQYEPAGELLRRAITVVRRNNGLYDLRQYSSLQTLIDIDGLLGRHADAAGNLKYLERISEQAHGARSLQHAASLTSIGDGFCSFGDFFGGRQRHRAAIAIVEKLHADHVRQVDALLGIVRCTLQELASQGITTSITPIEFRGPIIRSGRAAPQSPTFNYHIQQQMTSESEDALTRAAALVRESAAIPPALRVATLLQAGDWFQIKGHLRTARSYYLLAQSASLEHQAGGADTILATPVQILYPTPPLALRQRDTRNADESKRYVLVDFTVGSDGRMQSEQVIKRDASKSMVDATLSALRMARYRPRFEGDKPVDTEHVQYEQIFDDSRTPSKL